MGRKKKFSSNKKINYTIQRRAHTPFTLQCIQNELTPFNLPKGWTLVTNDTNDTKSDNVTLSLLHLQIINETPTVTHTITISTDLSYTVTIYNHLNVKLPDHPVIDSTNSIITLINYLSSLSLCPGISDSRYFKLADSRGGIFLNRQG